MDRVVFPDCEYTGDSIKSGYIRMEDSIQMDGLPIDTLSTQVDGSRWRGTRFVPRGSSGLRTADNKIFYVRPLIRVLVHDPKQYSSGTPVYYYRGDMLIGKYFTSSTKRIGKFDFEITCVSAIGLLEMAPKHYGGIYDSVPMRELVASIIGDVVPYTLDPVFSSVPVHGWLPIGTRRENLHRLLFAEGAIVKKNERGDLYITTLSDAGWSEIGDDRVFVGGSVEQQTPATRVEISEHTFIAYQGDAVTALFEGGVSATTISPTPQGATLVGTLVPFDNPMHDLVAENGTILESGVNYAILAPSGYTKLTGQQYTHVSNVISRTEGGRSGLQDNVCTVADNTLISPLNSENVAARALAYWGHASTVSADIVAGKERPSDAVTLHDAFGDLQSGYMQSFNARMSNVLRAECTFVVGYIPTDTGNYYTRYVVLTGAGVYNPPPGVSRYKAVLISGGFGGYSGKRGKDGKSGKSESGTLPSDSHTSNFRWIHPGYFGEGGDPGTGALGGRVAEYTIEATSGVIPYQCGVGGSGGDASDSEGQSNPGAPGTDTVFGTYTSQSGKTYEYGYKNTLSGEIYAASGAPGIAGGSGMGDPEKEGVIPGTPVTVNGITYVAGAPGTDAEAEDSWNNGSSRWYDYVNVRGLGGKGGGAAAGANGPNGLEGKAIITKLSGSKSRRAEAIGGSSCGATPAIPGFAQTALGGGGNGGHGGGGGGAPGEVRSKYGRANESTGPTSTYIATAGTSTGGRGGPGGAGGPGCIIIFF